MRFVVDWQGISIADFDKAGAAVPAPPAGGAPPPPPPPGPPPPPPPADGPPAAVDADSAQKAALFASLNKGTDITKG